MPATESPSVSTRLKFLLILLHALFSQYHFFLQKERGCEENFLFHCSISIPLHRFRFSRFSRTAVLESAPSGRMGTTMTSRPADDGVLTLLATRILRLLLLAGTCASLCQVRRRVRHHAPSEFRASTAKNRREELPRAARRCAQQRGCHVSVAFARTTGR